MSDQEPTSYYVTVPMAGYVKVTVDTNLNPESDEFMTAVRDKLYDEMPDSGMFKPGDVEQWNVEFYRTLLSGNTVWAEEPEMKWEIEE